MLKNIITGCIKNGNNGTDPLFLALPALINNPMRPIYRINPHIEAIIMHMNVLKCMNTFSQYTWADKTIFTDGILQPAFPCRRVELASMTLYNLYDKTCSSLIKSKLRKIREREIELDLRKIEIKNIRSERLPNHYDTMLNIFKQTPVSGAIVKMACGHHTYGSIPRINSGASISR